MGKTLLKALALAVVVATASLPKLFAENPDSNSTSNDSGSSVSVGLSSPCHGLLALRGVYDFNNNFGVQADLGVGVSGIDLRYKKRLFDSLDVYGYAGVIGISPWIPAYPYDLSQSANGPAFGADIGGGIEIGGRKGFLFGIEGGLVLPIPSQQDNTQAFRVDLNLMYRIPLEKK